MKSKRYIWHPATVFFLLACLVVFLSWISEVYGMNIVRSETGEVIRVRSLLSPEGLRWLLRHVVENYVEFRALGPVLLVVAGVSVCLHSGLADACMRKWGWSYCHRTSECRQLSRKERRALQNSILVGIVYWIIILFATFSPWAVLRGIDGGLVRSPFVDGFSFLFAMGAVLMGTCYGFISGRYRRDYDVVNGMLYLSRFMVLYLVVCFFASQMFACLDYSRLDTCISGWILANWGWQGQQIVSFLIQYIPLLVVCWYYFSRDKQ